MRVIIVLVFLASFGAASINGQSTTPTATPSGTNQQQPKVIPTEFDLHQLYLDKPIQRIQQIQYDKSGEKIEGEIMEDGMRILMRDYYKKGRVKVTVLYTDGTEETFTRSSCYIDPVIPI